MMRRRFAVVLSTLALAGVSLAATEARGDVGYAVNAEGAAARMVGERKVDQLGFDVPSPFLAKLTTTTLTTSAPSSPTLLFVVTSAGGAPVVIHRIGTN